MNAKIVTVVLLFVAILAGRGYGYTFTGSASATPAQNKQAIDDMITYVNDPLHQNTSEIIDFPAGIIQIEFPQASGQFAAFHTSNKKFRGSDSGTQLKWIMTLDAQNRAVYEPHSFWWFPSDCSNIEVVNLQFNTNLPDFGSTPGFFSKNDGCHIKTGGTNVKINYCMFFHSPSFAILVGAGATTTEINYCTMSQCHRDAVHVSGGTGTTIENSVIEHIADDGIGLRNDDWLSNSVVPQNITVRNNSLSYTHSRGILVTGVSGLTISHNDIDYTAGIGIEVNDFDEGVVSPVRLKNTNVTIEYNTISNCGYIAMNVSPWGVNNMAHGMWIANTDMVTGNRVHANVISNVKFDGILHGASSMTGPSIDPVISATYLSLFPSWLTDDGNDSNDAAYNYVVNANVGGNSGGGIYQSY